jgi:hypothetical protein
MNKDKNKMSKINDARRTVEIFMIKKLVFVTNYLSVHIDRGTSC